MTTPLGGPSQILVKCRNADDTGGNDVRAGDAVFVVGAEYDTDTGEPILLCRQLQPQDSDRANFLGIAVSAGAKGTGASTTGGYFHTCVFGLVQARVSNVGSAAVAAGEGVYLGGTVAVFQDGGSGRGVLGDDLGASGGSGLLVGFAPQTGAWGSSGGSQTLSWVFLNGVGRHGFGYA